VESASRLPVNLPGAAPGSLTLRIDWLPFWLFAAWRRARYPAGGASSLPRF
jgi:hypothetical protein